MHSTLFTTIFRPLSSLLLLSFLSLCLFGEGLSQELYINEVMASNGSSITDEDGDNEDWVEILYLGDDPLDLEGYGISDDEDNPFRWEFPDVTIQPDGYLLVWTSGKDRNDPGGELHTNFSISAGGEVVLITAPGDERLDELEPTEIPTDISLGRYPDGRGDWYFYENPTPGEPNGAEGYQEITAPVEFSRTGGFYSTPFDLELTHSDAHVTIYYTLDGSEPDPEHVGGRTYEYMDRYRPSGDLQNRSFETLEYDQPISVTDRSNEPNYLSHMQSAFESASNPQYYPSSPVFKGSIVRAIAVKDGATTDRSVTHTYFITDNPEERYSMPVLSLAIQEDDLFDYEDGIYVPGKIYNDENPWQADGVADANYHQRGIEWERPASMELFGEETAERIHHQNFGVRLHGGWSRSYPMKSLRLYARNEYGQSRFNHPMFPDQPYNEYNRLMLRNSGNDWYETLFRDALMQEIVKHMKFETQAYQPHILFINGEYWGIQNLRERYDKHYLERVHGVDPENIDLLEGNAWVKEGDNHHYNETLNYMRDNYLNDPEHYEYIQTRIDVENYIDYQIAEIFVGNTDWPGNNIDFWRYRTDEFSPEAPEQHDGRWRWMGFDFDFGFYLYGQGPDHNTLRHALGEIYHPHGNPEWSTRLFNYFIESEEFQRAFISRYLDQLNTAFQSDRMLDIINDMAGYLEPEIPEHTARWSTPSGGLNGWQNRVEIQLIAFAKLRNFYARQHLRNYFDIEDEHDLTVNVSDPAEGFVKVNSINISGETPGIDADSWPWTGTYFEGIPVKLKAEPFPGFRFSHWEGIDAEEQIPEINRTLNESLTITAVFEEDPEANFIPEAFALSESSYMFDEWPADAAAGSYPDHMIFVYMDDQEPELTAGISDFTDGEYNLESRTRINGLGEDGFAFINTGNDDGNPGYPGTRLGGAILALNTQDTENIEVRWEGSTIQPNSRVYNLRLQYRIGNKGEFQDVPDENGDPVEYERNETEGQSEWIGPVTLPEEVNNKSYVQLLWRYYFTGERLDEESGQRSQMAVSAIQVEASTITDTEEEFIIPDTFELEQNYPNPFNPVTTIQYQLPENVEVTLEIFDMLGRRVAVLVDEFRQTGIHQASFDASGLSSGIYLYRLTAGNEIQTRQMVLVK